MLYITRPREVNAIQYDGSKSCREEIEKVMGEPLVYVSANVPYLVIPNSHNINDTDYLMKGDYMVQDMSGKWYWASKRSFENQYMPSVDLRVSNC